MSYTPILTNLAGSVLQNTGLTINRTSAGYMGTSTGPGNYVSGTTVSGTVLDKLSKATRLAFQLRGDGTVSPTVYNNLVTIGSQSIPALGNSKPASYTNGVLDETMSYGFLRLFPLQAYNEFYINNGSYSDFLSTFNTTTGIRSVQNDAIKAMITSKDYLAGTYSNMSDLISSDITGVNLSTLYWGQDLIATGRAIDLTTIDTFGNPDNLLRTINKNRATAQGLNVALLAAGLSATDLDPIYNGKPATPDQQRLIYAAFCLVMNSDLQDILTPLNVQTPGLETLADLLDPKKLFPNSYTALTYPEYNITPKPTNSKTYYLLYSNGEVNIRANTTLGSRLTNILTSQQAYACEAFSMAMMQIKNIKSMNIEKFSQVVTSIENVTDLSLGDTNSPTNQTVVNPALSILAKGSNSDGTYNMCDFYGCMTNIHYDWTKLEVLIKSLQTTNLANIYNNIYNTVLAGTNLTPLQGYINDANAEISLIKSQQPALANALNSLYSTFGTYLTKEQNARTLALGSTTSMTSTTTDVLMFTQNIGFLSTQTETKGPAQVLENIADTTNTGGNNLIAAMREARNALKLGLTGAEQDNTISDNSLGLAPVTGSMTSLGVSIVTGAAVVPGSLAGSPETTLVPQNLSIFNIPSITKAVLTPKDAVDSVTICNCDCWDK